jgi:hypothetical protein
LSIAAVVTRGYGHSIAQVVARGYIEGLAENRPTPGLVRRRRAAERLRRIKRELAKLEARAEQAGGDPREAVAVVDAAEQQYERISLEVAALPDISGARHVLEQARTSLLSIRAAEAAWHRKLLLADDEWLMLS